MAYGMRSSSGRRRGMPSRMRRSRSRRKVAVPSKKRTARTYTRQNSFAINSLARDVKYLKMARYGAVQKNLHVLSTALVPTSTQPCFCVINDIQSKNPLTLAVGCPWYQLNTSGASTIVSRFENNDATFFNQMNNDIIDGGIAYITSLKLCFRIFCNPDSTTQISNKRVRIDLFKQRSRALVTPNALGDIQQLPSVAAQTRLQNMANPTRNKFCPEYFQLIKTRFCFLNPSKTSDVNKGTGAAIKYVSMDVPFKHLGRVTQQDTIPFAPDTNPPTPPTTGWGVDNMPINQRLWIMISSDDPNTFPSTDPELRVTCQRYVSWRDTTGSSAL